MGWLIFGLIADPQNFLIWKLILIPVLFVIGLTVAVKSYFRAVHLELGKERLSYRYPFGRQKTYKLSEVKKWDETVIKRKDSTYKQLVIEMKNSKKLAVSNQENSNYDQIIKYLGKKVKK